jgi:phosphate-selective porin OprO/OprP
MLRYKFFIGFLLLNCINYAQKIKKDTLNNDLKLENLPYYSFGKGIGLTSPDSIFQFNIRFRMQNRISYYENNQNSYDAQIRRLRLRFDGFVGNPKFLYVIQLSFAPGDVGAIEEGEDINIIRDAALIYRPNKNWNFVFGQTKLPGNRQRVNSSGALQLTDRSINNAKFNIDRDFGFQVNYNQLKNSQFSYALKTAVSTGKGRNYSGKKNNSVALTGKLEVLPFGSFKNDGVYFEGDLAFEKKPKLMLSAAYSQNNHAENSQGQIGNPLFENRTLKTFFLDSVLKYRGFYTSISYFKRDTPKNPMTFNNQNEISYVFVGQGFDTQFSYVLNTKHEIIGRYSYQKPNEIIQYLDPIINSYTIGYTKYIWEHAFKLQSEITYNHLSYWNNSNNNNNWYLRFQIEIGI